MLHLDREMADLQNALLNIESNLRRMKRHDLITALRPGLAPEEMLTLLTRVGLRPNTGIQSIYQWHDGTTTENLKLGQIYFLPGFYLLSLEDATANYREFSHDSRWTRGHLPFLADGGGDFYTIDLDGHQAGIIRHFYIDSFESPIEYESIEKMIFTIEKAYDLGLFYLDQDGYLEMNDVEFSELAARMNQTVTWWTE